MDQIKNKATISYIEGYRDGLKDASKLMIDSFKDFINGMESNIDNLFPMKMLEEKIKQLKSNEPTN